MSPALPRGLRVAVRDNDIDLEPDELGRDLGEALVASLRPAILDRDGATLDPAEFAQPLHKSGDPLALGRRRARAQEPDGRQLSRLLRARRERPRRRRAAEQRDELAPLHSITSSARASSVGGTVEAERLGGLEVDDQLELGGLLDRQVGRLLALEDPAGIDADLTIHVRTDCFRSSSVRRPRRTRVTDRSRAPHGGWPARPVVCFGC